jgi:hypothetical protein
VTEPTCLGLHLECGLLVKASLTVGMAFVLFVGSVFMMLSFVVGRWMAYLVTMVALSGWMIMLSAIWAFGLLSQGPDTQVNLGPRGREPAWVVYAAGVDPAAPEGFQTFASYPGPPWRVPGTNENDESSVQSVTGTVQKYLAEQTNERLGLDPLDPTSTQETQYTVEDIRFAVAEDGKSSLAAARAFFNQGGPVITVYLKHDSGSVQRYSYMFLAASIVLFAAHLPLLDRAEKKRKEFLTGGGAPPWYGPA